MNQFVAKLLPKSIAAAIHGRSTKASDAICLESITGSGMIAEPRVPAIVYIATLVMNLLALALPLTILQVYDRVIPNHAKETLAVLFVALSIALLVDFFLKNARSSLLSWQATIFVKKLSNEAIARLTAAPSGTIEWDPPATHINRYNAIAALGDHYAGQSRVVAIDLPFVAIALVVMALVGGTMVLVPVALFCFFAAISIRRSRGFRDVIEQRSIQDNKKFDFIAEVLDGILSVKAMAMEPQMQRRFERLQQSVAKFTAKSILESQAAQTSAVLYGSVSQVVVVTIGATRVIDNQLSIGALACCTMLSGQILQPLLRTISLWMENQTVGHRRAEVNALLSCPAGQLSGSTRGDVAAQISLVDVGYNYSESGKSVFKGVSLEIPIGSIVGVQGEDGSGRSTLLDTIRGELIPTMGSVKIAGVATTDLAFRDVRPLIAYVGSSPEIFRGTILENITLFSPGLNDLARRMCAVAGLDRAINILPDGFETKLGEGIAEDLPVSIAQQLAIVRALTRQPSILILDEANTVLDRAAEASLIRAVHSLRGRTTVIIATHRPSLLSASDWIVRMKKDGVSCEHHHKKTDVQRGVA
jgi:ATP-binding cassette subfamily C protein LapB